MTVRRAQELLRRIGWPLVVDGIAGPQTRRAIRDFQRGWAGRRRFRIAHGRLSRYTRRALEYSARHGGACGSRAPHFRFREFKSVTRGGCRGDGWIRVRRELVLGLERYRKRAGPTPIVSGYRDPAKNACVGGVSDSQHLFGQRGRPGATADRGAGPGAAGILGNRIRPRRTRTARRRAPQGSKHDRRHPTTAHGLALLRPRMREASVDAGPDPKRTTGVEPATFGLGSRRSTN